MQSVVLAAGVLLFIAFWAAVKLHFTADVWTRATVVVSAISGLGLAIFIYELASAQKPLSALQIGLLLFAASAALFAWALTASRHQEFNSVFAETQARPIVRSGPFRYIRHPFYTSYIVYWLGVAIAAWHPLSPLALVALVPAYIIAARSEERNFDASPLAADYAEYRRSAGLFWPKVSAFFGNA